MTPDQSIYWATNLESEGKIVTNREYPVLDFMKDSALPKGCLGYFIGFIRDKKLLASNCLAAHSSWMSDMTKHIRRASIHDLMLPGKLSITFLHSLSLIQKNQIYKSGTHNSGAYSLSFPQTNIAKRKYNDYTLCQDESVFNQLVYGIRFLDIRVAYKGGNHFTITHDKFAINHRLDDVLDQIAKFMEMSPGEVVIVDFHRFPRGFPQNQPSKLKEIHKKMFQIVKNKLGMF